MKQIATMIDRGFVEPRLSWTQRAARNAVRAALSAIRGDALTLIEGTDCHTFGRADAPNALRATIHVRDAALYPRVMLHGSMGAAEAFMRGMWTSDDLTTALRIFLRSAESTRVMDAGLARLAMSFSKLLHMLRRNTRAGSARNIAAHYDLGNEFFSLFLDETLMYSCAWFERDDTPLREASIAKNDLICRKLDLSPADHLLEIGTGWGGFALHAAQRYGCRITTTTISRNQHELASQRVAEAGMSDRVTVLLRDYRELGGQFDKLVSIEMIEAVGWQYYDAFFRKCGELLRPTGRMLLQSITIRDQHFEACKCSVDFIQRYIFPGSCLPSLAAITASVARASDLAPSHLDDLTPHYATTLRRWRERFWSSIDRVRGLRLGEEFIRMWDYYFCYCEAGFLERQIGDMQLLLLKPRCRPNQTAAQTRD